MRLGVIFAAGNHDRVHAFVGVDEDGKVRTDWRIRARGHIAGKATEWFGPRGGRRLLPTEKHDGDAGFGRLGIELLDEAFDGAHVFDVGGDEKGVHPAIGDDVDWIEGLAFDARGRLRRFVATCAGGRGGCFLEREDTEIEARENAFAIELRDDAVAASKASFVR